MAFIDDSTAQGAIRALADHRLTNLNLGVTADASLDVDPEFDLTSEASIRSDVVNFHLARVDAINWAKGHVLSSVDQFGQEQEKYKITEPPEDLRDGFVQIRCHRA